MLITARMKRRQRINPFLKAIFFYTRLFIIKNKTILATVRIKLIAISHPASGPEPKTIGIGPIKIMPPTLPDPPKTMEATTKTAIPTKTKAIPKSKKPSNRPDMLIPSSSASSLHNIVLPQQPIVHNSNN